MIKLENFDVMGWEHAIRGMRNPMNSWEKSDSGYGCNLYGNRIHCRNCNVVDKGSCMTYRDFEMGENDLTLMMKLANGGPVHAKYRRMITVYVDITAPLYWWKEFDTYKVGTVANSCSTMHKIHEKEFDVDDFSYEYLLDDVDDLAPDCPLLADPNDRHNAFSPANIFVLTVKMLNACRAKYLETKERIKDAKDSDEEKRLKELAKIHWWQMIQLLPTSYNQKRTVMLNYEVLAGIYPMRKNHKLDEWVEFCAWIEKLPYSEIITGKQSEEGTGNGSVE